MIIVRIHGGLVTEVANIPEGLTVEVRDYDIEGADMGSLKQDEEGSWYIGETYGSDDVLDEPEDVEP